jgi:tetratricopeptide (TPR) repeat protein
VPPRADIAIDRAFELVLSQGVPHCGIPSRLDALFADLKRSEPACDPNRTMELIWAIWIDHRDKDASHRMIAAVEAIAAGARDLARPILDALVEDFPDWAEAWNKRATLAFIEKRDDESIDDITRTLELEPRHFGAILGFAQICLRHGHTHEAKAAFEIALRLNPHIVGLDDVVRDLAETNRTLH